MTARMREFTCVAVLLGILPLAGTAPVPRKSPELTYLDRSGNATSVSSFRDKVVLIEFMLMDCPHCARVTQMINKLHSDLGPRGFQPIGVAFDTGASGPLVTYFVQYFKVNFPVGYTSSNKVDSYLGRSPMEQFQVPQIVVIDRKGVIRAQSLPINETNLEDETYLRNLLDMLLKEGGGAGRPGTD